MLPELLAALSLAAWLAVLLLPSAAWRNRERLQARSEPSATALEGVSVLIPARDEAASIGRTLAGLAEQGRGLEIIVVDDQSGDGTRQAALDAAEALSGRLRVRVVDGEALPDGWGGKLWALEQGMRLVEREFCLLLDADIVLAPGTLSAALDKAGHEQRALVSVMAKLRAVSAWEKLLVPPFVYFFKLIYPFARVNNPRCPTAAAAGGFILVRTAVLREVGAFAALADALIDDCTLAVRIKRAGHAIWLGLSHDVASTRAYPDFASFRQMVTRTAFTQLRCSSLLLLAVVLLMGIVFIGPWIAIWSGRTTAQVMAVGALLSMTVSFAPTWRFYRLAPGWLLTLPLAAVLFLAMTIESAIRHWSGITAQWKGRIYRST